MSQVYLVGMWLQKLILISDLDKLEILIASIQLIVFARVRNITLSAFFVSCFTYAFESADNQ